MWRLLFIAGAAALAVYRVLVLRRRQVPASAALGFALDRRPLANLAIGALVGGGVMSAIFLVEWISGWVAIARVGPATALGGDLLTYLAVPLIEEFVFRCAILGALLLLVRRPSVAVVISAVIFGGMHAANPNASALSVLSTSLGGVAYGIAFAATERVWLPLGLHFGWNYAQARVFGFAISGGAVVGPAPFVQQHDIGPALWTGGAYGPEGGLIGLAARFVVIALIAAWITYDRRRRATGASHETGDGDSSCPV